MKGKFSRNTTIQKNGGLAYPYMPNFTAKSYRYNSLNLSSAQLYKTWSCSCCGKEVLSDQTQRGMKRTKCDNCKKETDRLVNTIRYWTKKVGIEFDLDGDWV